MTIRSRGKAEGEKEKRNFFRYFAFSMEEKFRTRARKSCDIDFHSGHVKISRSDQIACCDWSGCAGTETRQRGKIAQATTNADFVGKQ